MPQTPPGPWTLDTVKNRLRAEQVQREKAAAARYRRQEQRDNRRETQSSRTSSTQCSLLLLLILVCLLLSLTVLVLSSLICGRNKGGCLTFWNEMNCQMAVSRAEKNCATDYIFNKGSFFGEEFELAAPQHGLSPCTNKIGYATYQPKHFLCSQANPQKSSAIKSLNLCQKNTVVVFKRQGMRQWRIIRKRIDRKIGQICIWANFFSFRPFDLH